MVTTSRKTHARSAPPPEPELSATTELTTLREVYEVLVGRTKLRADIIKGRLIVSPAPTPEHQDLVGELQAELRQHVKKKGWKAYPGPGICADGSHDPYEPDVAAIPPDAPRWGDREIFASGVLMACEIVSSGSTVQDREDKPLTYAEARIPIYLLVDPIASPAAVTVFSEPGDGCYTVSSTVVMGKEIHIPDPIDFLLETSVFL